MKLLVHISANPITLKFLERQIGFIQKNDFEVTLVSSFGGSGKKSFPGPTVCLKEININGSISPFADIISIIKLYQYFREAKPTIVQAHAPKASLLGLIAAEFAGVPIKIFHIHGLTSQSKTGIKKNANKLIEKISCRLANRVFCVSRNLKKYIVAHNICPPDKITVFANGSIDGIDVNKYDPATTGEDKIKRVRKSFDIPENALVIGFVGRIVLDKGVTEIIRAWQKIKSSCPLSHLLFVGDFEKNDPLPRRIRQRILSDPKIHITKWVDDVKPYYAIMDILLLPSYREGLPYSILEAQAMEIPVVATNISGCNEIIENSVNGLLVPPHDADALEKAIIKYLENPFLRDRHALAGRKIGSQKFKPEVIWRETLAEYNRLIKQYAR